MRPKRILIIDRVTRFQRLCCARLSFEGHQVLAVRDPRQACAIIAKEPIDLILWDNETSINIIKDTDIRGLMRRGIRIIITGTGGRANQRHQDIPHYFDKSSDISDLLGYIDKALKHAVV